MVNGLLAFLFLTAGVFGMVWLIQTKPVPPRRHTALADVLRVQVAPVEKTATSFPVVSHGTVRPKNQVNIVPQVSGQVLQSHPDLAVGKTIPIGALLFEIDPTVYEARVRQADSEIRALEAALRRHDQERISAEERIANAERMLSIDKEDYESSRRLFEDENVGTRRDLDLILQKYLRQNGAVVELKSSRAMIPHLRAETEAQLEAARSRLAQAQHDLDQTRIWCPFDARVDSVGAETSQVVTAFFAIATLTDVGSFELSVGVDPDELRWLDSSIRPDELNEGDHDSRSAVTVRWALNQQDYRWRGYVTRFERFDEATRLARLVVEVRDADIIADLAAVHSLPRPRLNIGVYCSVELPASVLADALFVPRHAVHEDRWVYVFEADPDSPDGSTGRLGQREVTILRTLPDRVLVDYRERGTDQVCELRPDDRVIVSPLTKPIVGMRIGLSEPMMASSSNPLSTPERSSPPLASTPSRVVRALKKSESSESN